MSPRMRILDGGRVVLIIVDQELADYVRNRMPESVNQDGNIELFINKGDDVRLNEAVRTHVERCPSDTK